MQVLEIHCRSFRCLEALEFAPGPALNVLRGGNAQGKTSVLEAVLFAATSKSHRTANEMELARHGEEEFHINVCAHRQSNEIRLEAHWWRGAKRFKVNGVALSRVSDILGRLHTVFFSPEDIELAKGGASVRRRFLDMELSQVDARYLGALQQYRQALRQRNELLRSGRPDPDLIEAWDAQLAGYGGAIISAREGYVAELSQWAARVHGAIAQGETLELAYAPDVDGAESLARALERNRASDMRRGQTSHGPHRDDLEIRIAGHPARSFGSQGQQRTAALSIKLAELELIHARTGEYPVLMLDEVLAELDEQRARALFDAIAPEVQCLITTTDCHSSAERFGRECRVFQMERGRLAPA